MRTLQDAINGTLIPTQPHDEVKEKRAFCNGHKNELARRIGFNVHDIARGDFSEDDVVTMSSGHLALKT